ncbi:MAG: cytochrome P450 [Acidobacteria bacterium]|nr:cytochrome P450 [Acidobacteriota bacterium]
MTTLVYNPYSFSTHDDPYETYRRLREEAPAYWNDELEFWVLSRFDDVLEGFRDFATLTSTKGIALEQRGLSAERSFRQMIEMDPPEHTAYRKLVSRVFTGRRVAAMEDEIRTIIDGYIDRFVSEGSCDLVADLTGPFPMDVICAVLGIPAEDRAALRSHSDKLLIREDGIMEIPQAALDGMFGMLEYFIEDLGRRKSGSGEGLISDLLELEVDGRSLNEEELLGFCLLFVIAGHETTTKMVANSVELLSRHPEQRDALSDDPTLVPGAVEEVLRFHNSTQYMHRALTRDVERHGQQMGEGQSVLLLIGAANHDHREFGETAEQFNILRRPERHLAFGYGAHFCLGAALARMEGKVALEQIHSRMPHYEVDHEAKVRFHSSNVTGWTSLPISFATAR